jgi:hypothetical protein
MSSEKTGAEMTAADLEAIRAVLSRSPLGAMALFLAETCPECGTPGPQRHLSMVGGCATCAADDPRPLNVPLRNRDAGVLVYDMVLPERPGPAEYWTPFRDRMPRASGCYRLASGSMVHVKPGCRC